MRNEKARVIRKRELGALKKDTLIWVESRNAMFGNELDVECFQGIDEHVAGSTYEWTTCVEYLRDFDVVADYGAEYRFWTERPTEAQMRDTAWEDDENDRT